MTKQPKHQPSTESDDPAVQAEWRRLEAERLAEERAEAREDADEAAHEPAARRARGQWPLIAFVIALVAGIIAALVVNRPRPKTASQDSPSSAASRERDVFGDDASAAASDAARRLVRVASAAEVPPDRLVVRVGLRDDRSRDRLEALLAASGLRLEGDLAAAAEAAKTAEGAVAAERLAVSGRPETVDQLLDALAAASTVLSLEADGLLAEPPTPPQPDTPEDSEEPAATEPAPAETAPAAAVAPPARVRLWIELFEMPAEASPPAAEAAP